MSGPRQTMPSEGETYDSFEDFLQAFVGNFVAEREVLELEQIPTIGDDS